MHLDHLRMIESDETGQYSVQCGVNSRSCLLELDNFDLCSGALLPDVMHDLLEGVLQHVLQLLLSHCIEDKHYFSLRDINEQIQGMEFSYVENNRPSLIDNHKHIRQNGKIICINDNVVKAFTLFSFTIMDIRKITASDDWL